MFEKFDVREIKPCGWLKRQLEIQADGLSGNLDKIWPDIRESAWIGGSREGWERVPYWLDGFIPLAYLLDDKDKISRAEKYVTAILDRQQPDGWICPCTREQRAAYDVWAHFLINKVLTLYYGFSRNERAKSAVYTSMKCLYNMISNEELELFEWGKFRWFEALIPLRFLEELYHESWIIELGKILREKGTDYKALVPLWKRPLNKWSLETHVVNIAMMFKYEALSCLLFGEKYENSAEELWRILEEYNGTAVGTFTGDECLSGKANNQGTELCSVVELMYSCEWLYACTENSIWVERLEKLAFNALPAALSDDMWTHQYDQMVNQIACIRFPGRSMFRTNNEEAHLFGLEPHFGCCTANHNQGWPKLALNAFLRSDSGIVCCMMLPATLNTKIGDADVTLSTETEYPFRLSCKYTVTVDRPTEFELKIRIPSWAKTVSVNGETIEKSDYYTVNKCWSGTESFTVSLTDAPHFILRTYNLRAVEYGALIFALPIKTEYKKHEYIKDGVERKYPYCDYELIPNSQWRYGFRGEDITVCERKGDNIPFSSSKPSIVLKTKLCRVELDYADGYDTVADKQPLSNRAISEPSETELYPYGCAKLRMTEMPLIGQRDNF